VAKKRKEEAAEKKGGQAKVGEVIIKPIKPTIHIPDTKLAKKLSGAKMGKAVTVTIKGKLVRRSESADSDYGNFVELELGKVAVAGRKKNAGQRGQNGEG
jgi:hypothetical protein